MEATYGFKLFMSNASGTGLTNVRRKRLFQEIKMSSKMEPHINTSNMTIQEVAVDAVTPYDKNPRKIPQEAIDRVAASIKEFGFKQPIVVDKDMVIIVGHTRLLAAKKLGYETVPVLVASDLSPEKARAYRLADNKTNELTSWDDELLMQELEAFLSVNDFDMESFGFDMSTLGKTEDDVKDDDFDSETEYEIAKNNCNVESGDKWQLGNHVLMCGDSTDSEAVRNLMDGNLADICVTDPPYNIAYNKSKIGEIKNDNMDSESFSVFIDEAMKNVADSMKEGGAVYVFYADAEAVNFINAFKGAGLYLSTNLIWVKNQMVISWADYQPKHEPCLYGWKEGATHYFVNDRDNTSVIEDGVNIYDMNKQQLIDYIKELQHIQKLTVLREDKPQRSELHPTMKPVKLIARLVGNSSREGDTVLDLFGGSGTTLIVSEQMGRNCRMMEYDPIYCQVIINRWEALTGKTAKKIC